VAASFLRKCQGRWTGWRSSSMVVVVAVAVCAHFLLDSIWSLMCTTKAISILLPRTRPIRILQQKV